MDMLQSARQAINEIDKEMAELFVKRMQASATVGQYKLSHGLPVYDAQREAEVIRKNSVRVEDEELRSYYVNFLQTCMDLSKSYQSQLQNGLRVAYSGVEGAFAFIAAKRIFPNGNLCSFGDFKSAYNAVANGECDCCVLPIENSYAGEVGQTLDLIFSGTLYINGIYELEIHQNLLGIQGATIDDIRKVTSHPQALSQCHDYIELHSFEAEDATNTALAAKSVADAGDKSYAAIASAETAELYGLKVLEYNINKSAENTTRFAVLSKTKAESPVLSSTILMLTVKHEAGSLANAISIIAKYGYNMTALRSRPMKKHSWQYYFYIEIDGRTDSDNGKKMLEELNKVCDTVKTAGSFAPHTEI